MIANQMRRRALSPPQFLAVSFLALIAVGALLLTLPLSGPSGAQLTLLNALFTATSAVCVTGLIVVDTQHALSPFGQGVVLVLIQLGGLGYMTASTLVAVAVGRRLTVHDQLVLRDALQTQTLDQVGRLAVQVFKLTMVAEVAGALLLTAAWAGEFGWGRAAWAGLFHSVSAFNNAGFSTFSTGLTSFRDDVAVNAIVIALIIAGGIGFFVIFDVIRREQNSRVSVHSRFVLILTTMLLVLGTAAILWLESDNEATLGELGLGHRVLAALFQAVTPRTAGFNTIDIGALTEPALFLTMVLMFIGGAPGSTAGGVKVTTFGITVLALWATVRGAPEPTVLRRRIPADQVARAFFVCLIGFLALNVVAGVLLVTEGRPLLPILFEATSAFGTVGLSMGEPGSSVSLSGHFSTAGQLLIVAMMFAGRVGPLTLAFALAGRLRAAPAVRYAEGNILIG
jgi:trk system potassium uptake protein TrkH